jgi:hypothetical protein
VNDSDFMGVPYGHFLLLKRIIRELNTKTCNQVQIAHDVLVPSPQKRGMDGLLEIASVNVGLPKEDAPLPNRPSVVSYNLGVPKCLLKCNCCYHRMQDMVSLVLRILHQVMTMT